MPYQAGYAISDIASLKALAFADLVGGYTRWVISKSSWYGWNATSTATANDDTVVAINSAPQTGRFLIATVTSPTNPLARETVTYTSPTLAPQAKLDFDVLLGKRFDVLSIKTNVPLWVRIYPNATYRTNDTNRSLNEQPANDYVAFVDVVTTSTLLETFIIPNAACASMEATPSSNIRCTVVNLNSISSTVTINFIVVKKEA